MPKLKLDGLEISASPQELAAFADCVVVVTDHSAFDYAMLARTARLVVDTRNALKGYTGPHIVRL